MRPTIRRLAIAALLAASSGTAAAQSVYHGLTIVDPVAQTRTPNSYIVVDADRIVAIGTGQPPASIPAEERHDFSGRFAMPGLFDMHVHISMGPLKPVTIQGVRGFDARGNDSITRHAALMLLAHGITTVRDPGGEAKRLIEYRDAVAAGALLGPEAKVAGEIVHRTPFPTLGLMTQVSEQEPVAAFVRGQAEAGVDFIKLYEGLSAEDLAAGIAEARKFKLPTIAHLSEVSWTRAAEMGIDSLVHAIPTSPELLPPKRRAAYLSSRRQGSYPFFELYEHVDLDSPEIRTMVQTLARRRVWVDATLIAFYVAFWGDDKAVRDRDLDAAHPAFAEQWKTNFRFDLGWQPSDYARAKAIWPKVLRLVRMLHDAGVPMTVGTDMNNPFVAPGASLYREMQLHADAGISNWKVLRMATSEAARHLGLHGRTGALKPGLEADIIFLTEDPSLKLGATAAPAAVMVNGRLYDPALLRAQANAVAAQAPPPQCGDGCTPDTAIDALHEAVSAEPGAGWDRPRLRALFSDDARLVTAATSTTGASTTAATIDRLIDGMEQHYRATGVTEREYRREVRTFGEMASVYSSFQVTTGKGGTPARGLNHFQLLRSEGRWRIVSNVALMEGGGWSLPPRFEP